MISNSSDCWVSISGSGTGAPFFVGLFSSGFRRPRWRPETLEPAVGLQSCGP